MANFFSRLFRLADEPKQINENRNGVHPMEIGSSGTKIFGGYPSEEYLQQLRGRLRADVYDQMRRSDTQIKMVLSAVKNPLKSATWEIQPANDTPEAKADADFVKHILFSDMDRPFNKFLSEALTMADFGFSLFEIVDKTVVDHPKFGTYNGIRRLAWRSPRTIERWNKNKETGELESVSQYAYGDCQKVVDMPAEFLLLFNIDQEGDNYEGVSLIRPCYGPWKRKDVYLKLNAVGIERNAVPIPMAEVPSGKEQTKDFELLVDALESYTSHQKSYLMYPAGWKITLQSNVYDPSKVEASVDGEDKRMVKAFLANFLELGMNGTGAFALSNDLSDFFLSGLDQLAGEIEGPINQKLIPHIIEMNFGKRGEYPKLVHSGVSDKAGKELAEVMKLLIESKVIVPDARLETNMRRRFGLPEASLEDQRKVEAPTAPMTPPTTLAEKIRLAEEKRKRLTT